MYKPNYLCQTQQIEQKQHLWRQFIIEAINIKKLQTFYLIKDTEKNTEREKMLRSHKFVHK